MENLQLVLSVLGAIAIIAVLVHGFWSIRRQQPKSEQEIDDLHVDRKRDKDGFDAHGISEVRVMKHASGATEDTYDEVSLTTHKTAEPEPESFSLSDTPVKKAPKARQEPSISVADPESIEQMELSLNQDVPQTSLFEDPVTNRKPEMIKSKRAPEHIITDSEDAPQVISVEEEPEITLAIEAQEVVEPVIVTQPESVEPQIEQASVEEPLADPKDVLVLHVVAKEGEELNGAELLPSLLTLNFKFGDMDIFHRHEDNAGTGKVLFSLANMVKPGIFNPDEMEQFTTQGVVLFMTIPCYGDPIMNFSNMLNSAHQIADDLGGELLDGGRESWNEQKKQAYIQRIRANM